MIETNINLIDRVINNLEERRQNLIEGKINSIPISFLKRFTQDFVGIERKKYYVVTSQTKGAKTQFSSATFVYEPLLYAYEHPELLDVDILYFPLEETPEDVINRFICHLLARESSGDIRINVQNLTSTNNSLPLPQDIINLLRTKSFNKILNYFNDHIIFSNTSNPTGINKECRQYAIDHGKIYTRNVTIKNDITGEPEVKPVWDHYETTKPNHYIIPFIDHIGLLHREQGFDLKGTMDKMSDYLVDLRNFFRMSPVVIQQQSFFEGTDAFKLNKLRPTITTLADSKYTARDANVVLGLFNPFYYGLDNYLNYDVTRLKGDLRFLEVLINRGGVANGITAMHFDGATCTFEQLPLPGSKDMENKYKEIETERKNSKYAFTIYKQNNTINNE